MRGSRSLLRVQSSQVSGISVRSPKKSSSLVLEPKEDSSTPMRDSLSMPGMSWQPGQPYLRTSFSPAATLAGSARRAGSRTVYLIAGGGLPGVHRRRGGRRAPLLARLLGDGEDEGGDLRRLVLVEHEVRHAGARAEGVRVRDPAHHPALIELGGDAAQGGTDRRHAVRLGEVLVALGQVAAVAAELLEEVLAARDLVRAVQVLHAGVALDAVGGHLLAAEERLLDELDVLDVSVLVEEVPVRGLDAVDRRPLPAVAGCAAELLGRMLAEEELTAGVRLPRVRLVLEAGLVDAGVAGYAPIDARDRPGEGGAVELPQHELLGLWGLPLP